MGEEGNLYGVSLPSEEGTLGVVSPWDLLDETRLRHLVLKEGEEYLYRGKRGARNWKPQKEK